MVKKCLFSSLLCAALLGSVHAGQSGLFLGLGATFSFGGEGRLSDGGTGGGGNAFVGKTAVWGAGGEFTVGYKTFFLTWLGLRGYASIDYSALGFEEIAKIPGADGLALALDAALNVDLLFDIIPTDAFSLGVFAGVSGGLRYWHGPFITDMTDVTKSLGIKTQPLAGTFGLNAGVSMGFGRRHNLEVFTKIPFLENKLVDVGGKAGAVVNGPYAIGLRYTFTFAPGGSSISDPASVLQ